MLFLQEIWKMFLGWLPAALAAELINRTRIRV